MEIKQLNNNYNVVLNSKANYSGFKHEAVLLYKDYEIKRASIQYYNRTWEAYQFQSVIYKVINSLKNDYINNITNIYKNINNVKRLTPTHKNNINEIISNNTDIKELNNILSNI